MTNECDEVVIYRLGEIEKKFTEHLVRSEKSAEAAREADTKILSELAKLNTGLALTEQRVSGNARTIAALTGAAVSVAIGAIAAGVQWFLRKDGS